MKYTLSTHYIIVLFFCTLTSSLSAQEEFNISSDFSLVPPSPTAAALGEYGNVPVNLYAGLVDISIPIYTLQSKKINVPISLSYHASGHKVDEVASSVGLGWSLNAGGVITRTIRGLSDDESFGFTKMEDDVLTNDNTQQRAAQRDFDTEPDLFYFNVNGYSGKFTFNREGDLLLIPYQDVLIKQVTANEWTITTPDGTKYVFGGTGKIEQTTNSSPDCENEMSPPRTHTTSWYLSQIIHPDSDIITFEYEPHTIHYLSSVSQSRYASLNVVFDCNGGNACSSAPPMRTCTQHLRQSKLINWSFGLVIFSSKDALKTAHSLAT